MMRLFKKTHMGRLGTPLEKDSTLSRGLRFELNMFYLNYACITKEASIHHFLEIPKT